MSDNGWSMDGLEIKGGCDIFDIRYIYWISIYLSTPDIRYPILISFDNSKTPAGLSTYICSECVCTSLSKYYVPQSNYGERMRLFVGRQHDLRSFAKQIKKNNDMW